MQTQTPPKTRGLPLLGILPQLFMDPLGFLERARAEYGDIYTADLGVLRLISLNQPRHASHVFVQNAANYVTSGPQWEAARTLLGDGIVVLEGERWRRQRRMMQPSF